MDIELTAHEARIMGALIEKAITTPDQYPLSLNALVNACNQKSNRDPLTDLDERTVRETLSGLEKKHLVVERSTYGSRVAKYQHRFCNTGFGSMELSAQELAIICELLLRGAQTPGELRTRAARMADFSTSEAVETALQSLAQRAEGPFVVRLEREPGRRDSRYMHLLSGAVATGTASSASVVTPRDTHTAAGPSSLEERVSQLERIVAELQNEMGLLKSSSSPDRN
jgi:uncharacterized protein YceH (UPF0502 family)